MRKLYSIKEAYWVMYDLIRTAKYVKKAQKSGVLSEEMTERVMLAVTEVNNCPMCSYFHTGEALKAGLNGEEIKEILSGNTAGMPEDELPAIFFAQHYADSRCHPSRQAWETIVKAYGIDKARGILGAIRIITLGNTFGIPAGSLAGRFKGKPDTRSSLGYELAMFIAAFFYAPIVMIHAVFSNIFGKQVIGFTKTATEE